MSDNGKSKYVVEVDFFLMCLTALMICWWGEPDLIDALIHWLMK